MTVSDSGLDAIEHVRRPRRDALENAERVLAAAVATMVREGRAVPMSAIADAAGVGVATLYRRFPTREALLDALTERSFRIVAELAGNAAAADGPAIAALVDYYDNVIDHRDQLILPLHGGPSELGDESRRLQAEIRDSVGSVLERGRRDMTIRADVTAADLIAFGALLVQPLSGGDSWSDTLRRQRDIYVAGLRPSAPVLGKAGRQ